MKKYCEWCGKKQNSSEMIKVFYGETKYFCEWLCLYGHSNEIVIANNLKGSDKKDDTPQTKTSISTREDGKEQSLDAGKVLKNKNGEQPTTTHKKDYQNVKGCGVWLFEHPDDSSLKVECGDGAGYFCDDCKGSPIDSYRKSEDKK